MAYETVTLDVTAILRAHRHLLDEDTELRHWWRITRRDGLPPDESGSHAEL